MKLYHGDCLEELKKLEDNSVDAVITDPPYGLSNTKPQQVADVLKAWVTGDTVSVPAKRGGFMGKDWDSFVPPPAVWEECMRVLKPGGHMAVFAGARTQDLMGLSIRLAGFEIRDTLGWVYGSGFPKSMDIPKAIDKAVGAEGTYGAPKSATHAAHIGKSDYSTGEKNAGWERPWMHDADAIDRSARIYEGGSENARRWAGWGTALKPAIEPIILARKPLDGTVANNVLAHGVGGLNIDACRVGTDVTITKRPVAKSDGKVYGKFNGGEDSENPPGRFPANVLLDEHAAEEMDKQSVGTRAEKPSKSGNRGAKNQGATWKPFHVENEDIPAYSDSGGASRFFPVFKYQAKAPKKERPVIEREDGTKIQHNTVKPLALMEWLVSLIVPPGGVVLDPFAGSGTTLQAAINKGFAPIGIEQDADYIKLIEKRLDATCTTHKS